MDTVAQILESKGGQVWSASPDEAVYTAIERMASKNAGSLAVVKDGKLVGILSERDYTRKVFLKGKSSKETLIKEIMTFPVMCAKPDQKIDNCLAIMSKNGFRHMPVIQDNELVGMISLKDLVDVIIQRQKGIIHDLEAFIMG